MLGASVNLPHAPDRSIQIGERLRRVGDDAHIYELVSPKLVCELSLAELSLLEDKRVEGVVLVTVKMQLKGHSKFSGQCLNTFNTRATSYHFF